MENYIEYAPMIVVVLLFLFKHKLFVTPEQMQKERKGLLEEVERRFLSIVAFREFEKRIEGNFSAIERRFCESAKRFDKVDISLEHIKDILIEERK